jgi:DNA-binding transcriptional regulator YhcF (GntR family)
MANRQNKKGRSKGGERFVALPFYMLKSEAWRSLSLPARATLIEAAAFFRGDNNGYLALGTRILGERTGKSKATISRALTELEDKRFIEATFRGTYTIKNRKSSEYRLTWLSCDRTGERRSNAFMQFEGTGITKSQVHPCNRTVSPVKQRRPRATKLAPTVSPMKPSDDIPVSDSCTHETQIIYQRDTNTQTVERTPSANVVPFKHPASNIIDDLELPAFLDRRLSRDEGIKGARTYGQAYDKKEEFDHCREPLRARE